VSLVLKYEVGFFKIIVFCPVTLCVHLAVTNIRKFTFRIDFQFHPEEIGIRKRL